jgi:hypothetical protein
VPLSLETRPADSADARREERNARQRKRRAEMTDQQREEINRKQREYRAQRKVAMQNINKGRRLIGKNVGIYLPEPVFSHGQLYVALSRGVSRSATRVLAKPKVDLDPTGKSTKNIVYRDVLNW